jgi:hypothetical protein
MNGFEVLPFQDHKWCLITPPPALRQNLLDLIPGVKDAGEDGLLAPWDLATCDVLSALDLPNESPMVRDYHWPIPAPWDVMEHQFTATSFLVTRRRAYLLMEQGTSKTFCAAWAADYLMRIGRAKRVLVISVNSTLDDVWAEHIHRLGPQHRTALLSGSKKQRLDALAMSPQWAIINYEGVGVIAKELAVFAKDQIIICDETVMLKNWQAQRTQCVAPLVANARYAWALTGAPTPQSPEDAYGQARTFTPWTVPTTEGEWKFRVMEKRGPFKWVPRDNAAAKVAKALSPSFIVRKRDVLKNLPPCTKEFLRVPLSAAQETAMQSLKAEAKATLDSGVRITAVHKSAIATKLRQIAAGAVYGEDKAVVHVDDAPRFKELERILAASAAGKSLVMVPFKNVAVALHARLKAQGFLLVYGDVALKERKAAFDAVQHGDAAGIVAVGSTMAHGITQTACDQLIWYCPPDKSDTYQQANARIDRNGQKLPTTVFHLYATLAERKLFEGLDSAERLQAAIMSITDDMLA